MQINDLPTYPGKRDIHITDFHHITPALKEYPLDTSDYNFTNIFAWRYAYEYRISKLDGIIIAQGITEDGRNFLLPPIGNQVRSADVAYMVMTSARKQGDPITLLGVPTELSNRFQSIKDAKIIPDRANWDYVYKGTDLAELPGQKFHAKRNLIKQFINRYDTKVEKLNAETCAEAIEFSDKWCKQRNCETNEGLEKEKCAIFQMLSNFNALKLHGILVRIGGEITGLAIGEELNHDTYIVHVEKGDQNFKGIYQFINQQLAAKVAKRYKWINREQDLGITGLRNAKLSYNPHHFIEKFGIELVNCK